MSRVIEVLYHINKQMHYGFFKEEKWHDVVNEFFIEGNVKIPEKLKNKNLNKLKEKDYAKFFEALDYTIVGISEYDPDVHQHTIISKELKDKELPEC